METWHKPSYQSPQYLCVVQEREEHFTLFYVPRMLGVWGHGMSHPVLVLVLTYTRDCNLVTITDHSIVAVHLPHTTLDTKNRS